MRKSILWMLLVTMLVGCKGEADSAFLIRKEGVGPLERTHTVGELESVFSGDSLVKDRSAVRLGSQGPRFRVYEKGGALLLTLSPREGDSSTVTHVRIEDARYKTEAGIDLSSTFGEVKNAYTIRNVVTTRNNVIIFIRELDLYFTISKEELPPSLRYAASTNIEAVQIPDKARLKYLMIGWDI